MSDSAPCVQGELSLFFFFQAEDGIRDLTVTGVQTCALPISGSRPTANLSTPVAGRGIPPLLAPQNAGVRWTQRSMESHFGNLKTPVPLPNLRLVNKVVRHLREEAFIAVLPDRGFQFRDPLQML